MFVAHIDFSLPTALQSGKLVEQNALTRIGTALEIFGSASVSNF